MLLSLQRRAFISYAFATSGIEQQYSVFKFVYLQGVSTSCAVESIHVRVMAASPIPSAASLSDGESASTVVLGDDPPVPVDDGLFWDINICPSDPIGWTSFGLLGPMFNSKNECKWRRLSVTQTVRMQQKVGYVFIQGLSGGFFKHDVEDQVQFEGNVTVYRLVHKGTGHSILIRSMPKGSFVGSVFLTLEHNDTLYIKVHSNINPEKILFLHKLYHCKSMTRRDLTYMVWKYISCI